MYPNPSSENFNWTADLEQTIEEVIARARRHPNGKTATAIWHVGGRALHAKVSSLSLGLEAALLQAELARPDVAGASAIRLEAFNAKRNVLVTKYVEGQSLFNVVWNGFALWSGNPSSSALAVSATVAAARWVRRFHEAYSLRDVTSADVEDCRTSLLQRLTDTLDSFQDTPNSPFDESELTSLTLIARMLAASSDWSELPVTRVHGDFTAQANIIVDGAGAVFIADFEDSHLGFGLEDIARLWTAIWEIGETRWWSGSQTSTVLPTVLTTGGFAPHIAHSHAFRLFRMLFALRRVREAQLGLPGAAWSVRRFVKRLARPQLRWLRALSQSPRSQS